MKRKALNLARWGDLHIVIEINKCAKCDKLLKRVDVFGCTSIGVCVICKKFFGLEIVDITNQLTNKFKKKILI